ncbi:helix-turn-helix transcriptional regulator [Bacillus pacificus]|nr:helix-turn-helix transcriptional regulator [Bacillus pacificus]
MIGEQIKSLRKKAKLTQQDLAEGIITRSYLSQIEQGSVQPTYEVLEKFAKNSIVH